MYDLLGDSEWSPYDLIGFRKESLWALEGSLMRVLQNEYEVHSFGIPRRMILGFEENLLEITKEIVEF